jgi:hypothetical protein
MRYTFFGVAAFLAISMVAPATAFEFDSTGGAAPGAAANYADPYASLYGKDDIDGKTEESEAPNGTKMLNGLQLSISGGGRTSSSVHDPAMGWTNPQPGRLTH